MREYLIILTVVVGGLVLSGCAGGEAVQRSPEINAIDRVTQVCKVYDATLRSLAVMKPRLSEEQIATVDQWRPILNGICTGEVPDVAAESLLDTMEKALFELSKIKEDS